ncbi:MAG TPA: NUDIX domain-containing protein [Bacillota bacterium]|nr:NUDIX domain-containing protein [Bacillota bacterium]
MKAFKHKLVAVIQHLVIVCRGKVLLLRYSDYQGKGVEGLWGLPGGHYISGDPPGDLLREVREETGLAVKDGLRLLSTYAVMFPDGVERFGVFYGCDLGDSPAPPVVLSGEHTDFMWAGRGETAGLAFIGPYHKKIVEEVLAGG